MCSGLACDEIEGIESGKFKTFLVTLAINTDGEKTVAQSETRAAGFAQWKGNLGERNHLKPFHSNRMREISHVVFLIDQIGIQHIIDW